MEHIDRALQTETHSPMYMMHKYWARKPSGVVSEYIRHYTQEGDIVLDPFCGSGVTPIEAIKLGRKGIGIDLDPMSMFIARNTARPIQLDKLETQFSEIEKNVKEQIFDLFSTACSNCSRTAVITHVIWDVDAEGKEHPTKIWYRCLDCSKQRNVIRQKIPDVSDLTHISRINSQRPPYWYPTNRFIWNSRINVSEGEKVSDLFSRRNLIALSIILNEIKKIKDRAIAETFEFIFTSSLAQASRLIPVVHNGKECKSWTLRGYWMPPKHFEINAWNCFENRYKKIYNGKNQILREIDGKYKDAKAFSNLQTGATFLLLNQTAIDLSAIPSESVDYIFTDPPYGDSVPYLELNFMWSAWLGFKPDFEDEIIISDSPERKKTFEDYTQLLTKAFKECFRVLKPKKWMTVTFHNADIVIYNSIIRSVAFAGFRFDKILYQPPPRVSAKSLLHPYGSASGDYYIRFERPPAPHRYADKTFNPVEFEAIVIRAIEEIIIERGEPVSYNDILKSIYTELDKYGYLLAARPENINTIMHKHNGKEFIFKKGVGWWFKDPSRHLIRIPLRERIETLVVQKLRRDYKVAYPDILNELYLNLENGLTPEPTSVKRVVEEYADKTSDGKWRLKPRIDAREREHNTIVGNLAKIGKKLGFDVSIGLREQSDIFEGEPLQKLSTAELQGHRPDVLERIRQIDVLWLKNGTVLYEFEVESTTGILDALSRGSYLEGKVKRIIVIPEEREKFLYKKLKAPFFNEKVEQQGWRFLFFKDVKSLSAKSRRKSKFDSKQVDRATRDLMFERTQQKALTPFLTP